MAYKIAGIDVHKRMLAVVVADMELADEWTLERRQFGSNPEQLRTLAAWRLAQQVDEVVMESTAQYWRPVWGVLERCWAPLARQRAGAPSCAGALHLAQAQSNRGRPGRKRDFHDAERLMKRLVSNELVLSFVPDVEQRLWRTLSRTKYQLTRTRVQLHNRLEALLEQARIKLSSLVSDLLGVSARRMLHALADGATDPAAVAALAYVCLRATPAPLQDALGACAELHPVYRRLLQMALADLELLETQMRQLDHELAELLQPYRDPVERLAAVPGFGVDSAQQVIAEVGPTAGTFPAPGKLASWVGVCPGTEQSAAVNASTRGPQGNRPMRRLLNQAAKAAVQYKGSIFQLLYRRSVPRLGHKQTIGLIAHRLCRLIWKILHDGARYEEKGPALNFRSKRDRAARMIRELRTLGYRVEPPRLQAT